MWFIILSSVIILFLFYIMAGIVCTIKKNNGIMDVFYGLGYFIVVFTAFILDYMLNRILSVRKVIVTFLVLFWAIRLSTYIFVRNRGKPEDWRYAAMRKRWKDSGKNVFLKSLTSIYMFQALVIFIVVFPVLWINVNNDVPLTNLLELSSVLFFIGVAIWIIGFYYETIGDYQLYKFLKNPNRTKKVMDQGLWKYTQHPNYFGEVTMWWGLFIIAITIPWGFITIFAPAYITFQIIKVSGVKLLNKRFKGDDEYAIYKRKTSSFFPWFPKKEKT